MWEMWIQVDPTLYLPGPRDHISPEVSRLSHKEVDGLIKKKWDIHHDWLSAPNLFLDPECPKLQLNKPFHIGPGVCIGGLGFGYYEDSGVIKVKPHNYGVIVQAGASIHPHVTIDRGSHRDTVVGPNAKLNAFAFIGHNVDMARNVLMGVKSTVSGSTVVGQGVIIWSHAYVSQHCKIEDGAIVGAYSHVRKGTEIGPNEVWWGNPATYQRMRGPQDEL